MTDIETKEICGYCEKKLEGEEVTFPFYVNGEITCDDCYYEKCSWCPLCGESFDDTDIKPPDAFIILYHDLGYYDKKQGIYQVIKYPFYSDGMITVQINWENLRFVRELTPQEQEESITNSYICQLCSKKEGGT